MSIYNRNEPEPGEWQTDPKTGERFRMIGHIREYEPVTYISGIPVPQSQIADFHKRQKEAEERRKAAAAEEWKNRPEPKSCPFSSGNNNTCKREKCSLFLKGKCAIAILADAHGTEQTEQTEQTQATKCPFSIYGRCKGCALFNNGCAVVRLAAATYKE